MTDQLVSDVCTWMSTHTIHDPVTSLSTELKIQKYCHSLPRAVTVPHTDIPLFFNFLQERQTFTKHFQIATHTHIPHTHQTALSQQIQLNWTRLNWSEVKWSGWIFLVSFLVSYKSLLPSSSTSFLQSPSSKCLKHSTICNVFIFFFTLMLNMIFSLVPWKVVSR